MAAVQTIATAPRRLTMRKLVLAAVLALVADDAYADKGALHIVAGVGEGFTVAFPSSGGVVARPPATIFSLGLVAPMDERWLWYIDIGMKTRNDALNPAPQVVLGPGLRLTGRVTLWFTAMYRYTPSYLAAADFHIVALTLTPAISVAPGVAVLLGVSGGINISGGHTVPELGFGPKLSFTLW